MIAAGELKHIIQIQQKTAGETGEYGDAADVWAPFLVDLRCKITPLVGRELVTGGAEQSLAPARFKLRFVTGITTDMRILDEKGRLFRIVAVADVGEQGREIEILGESWVRNGA